MPTRTRSLFAVALGSALALVVLAAQWARAPSSGPGSILPDMVTAVGKAARDITLIPDTTLVEGLIPQRTTLDTLLRGHGVADDAAVAVVHAAGRVFDPRRLRSLQPFSLERTLEGALRLFEYRIDADTFLRVTRTLRSDDAWTAPPPTVPSAPPSFGTTGVCSARFASRRQGESGGTVASISTDGTNGRMVRLRHASGYESRYLHLSAFASGLRTGQRVDQGDTLGFVGSSGLATGPHLHYGLTKHGVFVNPLVEQRNMPPAEPLPPVALALFQTAREAALVQLARATEEAAAPSSGAGAAP